MELMALILMEGQLSLTSLILIAAGQNDHCQHYRAYSTFNTAQFLITIAAILKSGRLDTIRDRLIPPFIDAVW